MRALTADAGHSLGDVGALLLAWYADRQRHRPPTAHLTFGWGVHDLHVWAVGSDQLALACHVTLAPEAPRADEVLCHLHDRLAIYGIHHSTIQIDPEIERHPEPVW